MKSKVTLFTFLCLVLLTVNLGSWGVTETSESRYAEISKEMLESGDYTHPTLMGISHYHKPPVTYYITTLGYRLFGVNEFGARFFLQIALIIQLILIYQLGLLLFKEKQIAWAAMLIYFSLPLVLISSRNLTTDAYLNTSVLAAIFFWLSYKLKGFKPLYVYLFFLALGISFEIKGPIGLIFILLFILSYQMVTKQKMKISLHHAFGFLLFLLVAFGWYLILLTERPALWEYFFEGQLVDRAVSKSYHRAKPFWYYLLTVPLIGLPWIFFLVHLSIKKFKTIKAGKNMDYVLLMALTLILFLFSVFKTKLILYVLPAFGFIALLMAKLISETKVSVLTIYNKVIFVIAFIFWTSIVVLSRFELHFEFNGLLGLAIGIISAIAFLLLYRRKYPEPYLKTVWIGFAFGCLVLITGNDFMMQNEASLNSTKPVMDFVKHDLKNIQTVYVYNYLLPSTEFYSQKKIVTLNNGHNTVQRETQFESSDHWKPYNLDLKTPEGETKAREGLNNTSVLITRKKDKIPNNLSYLIEKFQHTKDFGVWRIYY